MCNHFKSPKLESIQKYLQEDLDLPLVKPNFELQTQDIFPKTPAPVLLFKDNQLLLESKTWGYSSPINSNKVIFNARIERFYETKPSMWDNSFARQRCIIIAEEFLKRAKKLFPWK